MITDNFAAFPNANLPKELHALLVCGQGTYQDGHFYAEYNERDLYLKHILSTHDISDFFGYNAVVCAGSYTKSATPSLSEARSISGLWELLECRPRYTDGGPLPCLWEEASLDSAQNVLFGLMRLRMSLRDAGRGQQLLHRIGIWTVWKHKRNRFQLLADALGIETQFYFHGLAHASEATDGSVAVDSEQRQFEVLRKAQDPFMLAASWKHKRGQRNANAEAHKVHMDELHEAFPRCFAALSEDAWAADPEATNAAIRDAFQAEVMRGDT